MHAKHRSPAGTFADGQLTDALRHLATDPMTDKKVKKKLLLVLASWHEQFKGDPSMNMVANLYKQYRPTERRTVESDPVYGVQLQRAREKEEAKAAARREKEEAKETLKMQSLLQDLCYIRISLCIQMVKGYSQVAKKDSHRPNVFCSSCS